MQFWLQDSICQHLQSFNGIRLCPRRPPLVLDKRFRTKRQQMPFDVLLSFADKTLSYLSFMQNLGLLFYDKLCFDRHCFDVSNRACRISGLISRAFFNFVSGNASFSIVLRSGQRLTIVIVLEKVEVYFKKNFPVWTILSVSNV